MVYIILALAVSFLGYALIKKPEWIAILLFTFIIADVNIELNLLPLNLRAIISLLLFVRVFFSTRFQSYLFFFFSNGSTLLFLSFFLYIWLITFAQDLFTLELFKQSVLIILSCILLMYFYSKHGRRILGLAILIGAFICFSDLVFTYVQYGTFPIRRLHYFLFNEYVSQLVVDEELLEFNHNFFGQICAIGMIYLIYEIVFSDKRSWLIYFLLLVYLLGILMSTSRSALFGIFFVTSLIIAYGIFHVKYRRFAFKIVTYSILGLVLSVSLFSLVSIYFDFEGSVVDEITFRLIDEPIAVLQKELGYNYDLQKLGSLEWREEASSNAWKVYEDLIPNEKLFGIGYTGYLARNLGGGLNPHNGLLIVLIQYGLTGLLMYFMYLYSIVSKAIRLGNNSMALPIILFVILYSIGQNDELTSGSFFLFTFLMISENVSMEFETEDQPQPIHGKMDMVVKLK